MASNVNLNVLLLKNRRHPGWLRVEVDGIPKAEFRVLGRGSTTVKCKSNARVSTGNPTLNPYRFAGNTPTGDFVSPGMTSTADWPQRSYGPCGAVRLKAVGGDALIAEKLGRTGLLIHGGAPGQFDGYASTLGCLRLRNNDMRQLRDLLSGEDPLKQLCFNLRVTVTIRER
jgi:lipoprotein-anchoring transpeptidase ErfK/SrfK